MRCRQYQSKCIKRLDLLSTLTLSADSEPETRLHSPWKKSRIFGTETRTRTWSLCDRRASLAGLRTLHHIPWYGVVCALVWNCVALCSRYNQQWTRCTLGVCQVHRQQRLVLTHEGSQSPASILLLLTITDSIRLVWWCWWAESGPRMCLLRRCLQTHRRKQTLWRWQAGRVGALRPIQAVLHPGGSLTKSLAQTTEKQAKQACCFAQRWLLTPPCQPFLASQVAPQLRRHSPGNDGP